MPFEVGRVVDRYRVDHVVHTGRFTVVYAATDVTLGRKSALKVLSDHYAARPQLPRALRPRGAGRRQPRRPSEHGHRLRLGRGGRHPVPGHAVRRGRDAGGAPRASNRAASRCRPIEALEYLHQIAVGARLRPQPPVRAPRRQAGQRADRPRRDAAPRRTSSTSASPRTSPTTPRPRSTASSSEPPSTRRPSRSTAPSIDGRSDVYSLACTAFELLTGSSPFASGRDDTALDRRPPAGADPQRRSSRRPSLPRRASIGCSPRGLSKDAGRTAGVGGRLRAGARRRLRRVDDPVRAAGRTARRRAAGTASAATRRRWWIPAAIAGGAVRAGRRGVLVVAASFDGDDAARRRRRSGHRPRWRPTTTAAGDHRPAPPAPPTLPPVPAGALDLGFGAYVPLAAGLAGRRARRQRAPSSPTASPRSRFAVQQRPPGSTARDVLLEQVGGVDAAFPAVWYGVPTIAARDRRVDGLPAVVGRRIGPSATVAPTSGQAIGVVRADGLAVGYVQRAAPGTASTAYPGFDESVASLARRPGSRRRPPRSRIQAPPAVPSSHPQLQIDGPAGFTPAPSYRVVDAQPGYAFLTADGVHDVIASGHVVATPGELVEIARQGVSNTYPGRHLRRPDRLRTGRQRVHPLVGAGVGHVLRRPTARRYDRHVLGSGHDARLLVGPHLVRHRGRHRTVRRTGPVHGVPAVRLLRRLVSDG